MAALPETPTDDTRELYLAVRESISEFFSALSPERRKVVLGVSGGIDSALTTALYTDILGPKNVHGINMPSKFNSQKIFVLAQTLAENLGIHYEVRPIQKVVDAIAKASGIKEGTLGYENIQARSRMEILAARTQHLNCVFSANWNKIEAAFGYGTLYGDMAGAIAPIGDLVKREVYQLAEYMNREVFRREVIPQECFSIAPTAELRAVQKDPFDYGKLSGRGYHEEMVRAFTEFRRNPEWFLGLYLKERLEQELQLPEGRLVELFSSARRFVHDLEKHWRLYHLAFFKRLQGPPIPIVSKRAFGTDLRESIVSAHVTRRYYELRAEVLARDPERLVVFGGAFNPPGRHHREIVKLLLEWFDRVIVVPSGIRKGKDTLKDTTPDDRKEMAIRNFGDLPRVVIDYLDLDAGTFTPCFALDERYKKEYSGVEVWHAVGGDVITGGKDGNAEIQRSWKKGEEIWRTLNFAVMMRPGFPVADEDRPPLCETFELENFFGASTFIRKLIEQGKDVSSAVMPEVCSYIKERDLYLLQRKEA